MPSLTQPGCQPRQPSGAETTLRLRDLFRDALQALQRLARRG